MPSGSPRRAIGIVTRTLNPGTVTSRLASDIGREVAASLHTAFLRDVLVSAVAVPGSAVTVFHPAGDDPGAIRDLCPPGVQIEPEQGRGHAQVIPGALRAMLATAPVAALVGANAPGLPRDTVDLGFRAVESGEADIAICPTARGGCCFLAVNGDYLRLFEGVDHDARRVFEQIRTRAEDLGLACTILPAWYDVEDVADLERLANDMAGNVELQAAATRFTLRDLRQTGHPIPVGQPPWAVSERRSIYRTPWRSLVSDRLTTHTGREIEYAYLETDPAVWVVPVTADGRILLVRQYRHPIGEIILEVPAGSGGDPVETARRELSEETGGVARELIPIATFYPASAHVTHQGHVVLALDVEPGEPDLEATELLSVFDVPYQLAFDMARRGEIADCQSALAILAAEPRIRAKLEKPPLGSE